MEEANQSPLNPTVKKLGAVSFFADVASEMLYPITPIFMTAVLGASMSSLGLIEGIAESIASLLRTYSGSWSDKLYKRKPFVVIGYLLGAVSKPFIGMSYSNTQVLFARALDRTGKGLRAAPRDALIADSVNREQRGAAYGWHRGMDTLGAAVGPLISILLIQHAINGDLRKLYFWALLPGLASVIIALTVQEKQIAPSTRVIHSQTTWSWTNLSPSFKKYLFAWTLFSLTNSSDVFLLMKAKNSGLSTIEIVLAYCAYNFIYSFSSPYLGRLSDRIPRKKLMLFGLIVFSFVYLGFAFANLRWHFWLLFLCYGLYMGATEGVGKALAVDFSPSHLKATALGILGTCTGLATIFASTAAGLMWDHIGVAYPFLFAVAGSLCAAILIFQLPDK